VQNMDKSPRIFHRDCDTSAVLCARCLAPFSISYQGAPIALCSNRNGQAIMRYLIAQSNHSATADALMTLFWPEEDTDVALRRLQVTVSILRHSLSVSKLPGGFILYKRGSYLLDSAVPVHTDVDMFLSLYESGLQASSPQSAASLFEQACALYMQPFLSEDLYADWSYTRREQLRQIRLNMCLALASYYLEVQSFAVAAQWVTEVMKENRCEESAYQLLMQIHALQGKRHEALRVYQRCRQVLKDDLDMEPLPQTEALYKAIVLGEFYRQGYQTSPLLFSSPQFSVDQR
jgi:DNA-binding SARP family transcriptional activator